MPTTTFVAWLRFGPWSAIVSIGQPLCLYLAFSDITLRIRGPAAGFKPKRNAFAVSLSQSCKMSSTMLDFQG